MIKILYLTTGKYFNWKPMNDILSQDMEDLCYRRDTANVNELLKIILRGFKTSYSDHLPESFFERNSIGLPADRHEFQVIDD